MPVFSDGQSYVVWKDGSTYRAECLLKGGTDYSGTDAATVIQSAIDACEAQGGGTIFLKSSLSLESQVTVQEPIMFVGEGYDSTIIYCKVTNDYAIIVNDSGHGTIFKNLGFNGNGKQGNGIKTDGVAFCRIEHCDFYNFQTAIGIGGFSTNGGFNKIIDCHIATVNYGVVISGSAGYSTDNIIQRTRINTVNNVAVQFGLDGNSNSGTHIVDCQIENDGSQTAIKIGEKAYYSIIEGSRIENWDTAINVTGSPQNVRILSNYFVSDTTVIDGSLGTGSRVHDNVGYVTENGGTATISNGNTSIVVNHGCDYTPSAKDIDVHPIESLGSASFWWVDTITSTQFTIHVNADPGQDVDFKWSVRRI